jgi:hypothetical protein
MTCPARSCDPLYRLGRSTPVGSDPALTTVGNDLYVNTARVAGAHDLRSLKVLWVGEIDASSSKDLNPWVGHVAVTDGLAYMAGSRLYAFSVDCGGRGTSCRPTWIGPRQFDEEIQHYRSWSDPVVINGLVFASTDRPYAFRADCATDGTECQPLWVGPAGFASAPAVTGNAVAVTYVDGRVVVFEASKV